MNSLANLSSFPIYLKPIHQIYHQPTKATNKSMNPTNLLFSVSFPLESLFIPKSNP
jgi:hypothetical protein